jgi:hypothetical protein
MLFAERRWRVVPRRAATAALAVAAAMAIAGCGGGTSTQSPASSTASPAPAAATAATPAAGSPATGAATPASGSGSGDCGEAVAVLVAQHLARPDVVSVTTEGGCHDATIVTSLAPGDSATGLAICDSAAEVAYAGDISSITVLAANNKELAIGIKGQECIGEP